MATTLDAAQDQRPGATGIGGSAGWRGEHGNSIRRRREKRSLLRGPIERQAGCTPFAPGCCQQMARIELCRTRLVKLPCRRVYTGMCRIVNKGRSTIVLP